MSDELTPITRKETFLAKAGGQNVVTPTPITREETFLQAIIDNGSGGGGGGGGVLVCTLDLQTSALDKTWNEINNATPAFVVVDDAGAKYICFVVFTANIEQVGYVMTGITWRDGLGVSELRFLANSADGYPVLVQD